MRFHLRRDRFSIAGKRTPVGSSQTFQEGLGPSRAGQCSAKIKCHIIVITNPPACLLEIKDSCSGPGEWDAPVRAGDSLTLPLGSSPRFPSVPGPSWKPERV